MAVHVVITGPEDDVADALHALTDSDDERTLDLFESARPHWREGWVQWRGDLEVRR